MASTEEMGVNYFVGGFVIFGRSAHLSTVVHLGEKSWNKGRGLDTVPFVVKLMAEDWG